MFGMAFALFVLALVVALLWSQVNRLHHRLETLATTASARTPAMVTAAIEDLRTALAQVNATNRREFGAIWKRLGLSRRDESLAARTDAAERELPLAQPGDDFAAMIALQSADPVKPK